MELAAIRPVRDPVLADPTIAAGFVPVPGVGETVDVGILTHPNSQPIDRVFAIGSLVVSALTGGLAPNFGGAARFFFRAGDEILDASPDVLRATGQIDVLSNSRITSQFGTINVPRSGLGSLGRAGSGRGVRAVIGDSTDARKLFDDLRGSNPVTEVKPGVFVAKGKNGGNVTFRGSSKSGPPTVDVHGIEEGIRKIKFVDK